MDCGDEKRLGNAVKYFHAAKRTFCVDHHISNQNFADANYIFPEASSTCELVYELIDEEKITKEIAECNAAFSTNYMTERDLAEGKLKN